jgi:NAD+ synthase
MTDQFTIALAQIDPTVGDLNGNAALIRDARRRSAEEDADIVVFSELVICGYPPEDLVLKPFFQDKVEATVQSLTSETADGGPALLIGAPWIDDGTLYNAALLLDQGAIAAVRFKHCLPNYGVFDEKRVFAPGPLPGPVNFRDVRLGVMVCEDMWTPDVTECLEESGAELLVALNGSPFDVSKGETRLQLSIARVTESGLPLVYVNQVGGQDELVFDGASFVLNANCSIAAQQPSWEEHLVVTQWSRLDDGWNCDVTDRFPLSEGLEAIYRAMVVGLADYVRKNKFPSVILGLSGGIDSALSAAVAVDALGEDRVHCVMMPSPYTAAESLADARETADLLGVRLDTINIEPAMKAYSEMLDSLANGLPSDSGTMAENIQSRSRAVILMALSNALGSMVLTTGNKSEMSVGYATLYGDMCGGYSVLKDVYKTDVFRLAQWRNQMTSNALGGPAGRVIPERVITKAPSAELKPNQTDQDTLPPYEALDDILSCLVEGELGMDEITKRGHSPELVERVWRMLDAAEYKRRQAPPGVKITSRAYGRDRRYPITNAFRKII